MRRRAPGVLGVDIGPGTHRRLSYKSEALGVEGRLLWWYRWQCPAANMNPFSLVI